jgi:hypothetical protein
MALVDAQGQLMSVAAKCTDISVYNLLHGDPGGTQRFWAQSSCLGPVLLLRGFSSFSVCMYKPVVTNPKIHWS